MTTATLRPQNRPLLHLVLLGLTAVTTFTAFLGNFSVGYRLDALTVPALHDALIFSLTLLAILGCHEMGHYFFARYHRVDTSLPYFIPMPVLGVGTLGAVIRIRGRIPDRNALVDIAAAGPLAGMAVALPCLLMGLASSGYVPAPRGEVLDTSLWALGGELFGYLSQRLAGTWSPSETTYAGIELVYGRNLLSVLAEYLTLGPTPEGLRIDFHPMVIAAWFGMLVTMLNLIPIGQLDGGHLTYALFGQQARGLGRVVALGIFGLVMFATVSWALWLLVAAKLIGFRHPQVVDETVPLSPGRRWTIAACLLTLALCVMPVPLTQVLVP